MSIFEPGPGVTPAADDPPNRSAALETQSSTAAKSTKQRSRHKTQERHKDREDALDREKSNLELK